MTKAQEIQILRETAARLGKDSYCGVWLSEQIEFMEKAVASDCFPDAFALSMKEAEIRARNIIEGAKERAQALSKQADDERQREADALKTAINGYIYRVQREIRDMDNKIEALRR